MTHCPPRNNTEVVELKEQIEQLQKMNKGLQLKLTEDMELSDNIKILLS